MSQTIPTSATTGETPDPHSPPAAGGANLEAIYSPIRVELEKVDAILNNELQSDAPWIDELLEHSRLLGGKRMRPVFLLLSGASCGELTPGHHFMAAALEMVHLATLIHDDVLDRAETRRHEPTANSRWGNKVSVLLGDYLFTHAFHVASQADSVTVLRLLAAASNKVCAGEMRQDALIGNFEITQEEYFEVIADKTAELCSVGCYLGAHLAGASESVCVEFESFGRNLGVAFQIIDDVLDIVGHPLKVGKTLGTDIANRKLTLPLIHCLDNLSTSDKSRLLKVLAIEDPSVKEVSDFLNMTQSIEYSRDIAAGHVNKAAEFARTLPDNEYAVALKSLAEFVLQRVH